LANTWEKDMVDRIDKLLELKGADSVVDEIMEVCGEATKVHKQALIAMGQQAVMSSASVASTEFVMNLATDLSSQEEDGL